MSCSLFVSWLSTTLLQLQLYNLGGPAIQTSESDSKPNHVNQFWKIEKLESAINTLGAWHTSCLLHIQFLKMFSDSKLLS